MEKRKGTKGYFEDQRVRFEEKRQTMEEGFPDLEAIDQVTIDRKASTFPISNCCRDKKVISENFTT